MNNIKVNFEKQKKKKTQIKFISNLNKLWGSKCKTYYSRNAFGIY